jgi:ADP-ribose pyrophosphatase YjhB (NUDIX family)
MEMNFCRRCGKPLGHVEDNAFTCQNNHVIYLNTSPCSGVIFVNERKESLFITRAINPWKGMSHLPSGFCNDKENLEQTLEREIFEEIGLSSNDYEVPQYLLSHVESYDYKNEKIPVIVALFWSKISSDVILKPGDDASDAFFVPYDQIDYNKIKFETQKIGLQRLHKLDII